jgi:hypothetical protein
LVWLLLRGKSGADGWDVKDQELYIKNTPSARRDKHKVVSFRKEKSTRIREERKERGGRGGGRKWEDKGRGREFKQRESTPHTKHA